MGLITDYFVATAERAMTLAENGPAGSDVPILQMKWVEPAVLGSTLWAIIENSPVREGFRLPFDLDRFDASGPMIATTEDETAGVWQIADGFVQALAALPDDRIPAVAALWATADEWIGPWEPGELDDTVLGLRDLARQVSTDHHLYVWWAL
jgi:hypothetical protein